MRGLGLLEPIEATGPRLLRLLRRALLGLLWRTGLLGLLWRTGLLWLEPRDQPSRDLTAGGRRSLPALVRDHGLRRVVVPRRRLERRLPALLRRATATKPRRLPATSPALRQKHLHQLLQHLRVKAPRSTHHFEPLSQGGVGRG